MTDTTASETTHSNENPSLHDAAIIVKIRDEHKYSQMLMSALKDQLDEYNIGKTADYTIMLEIMNYLAEFPSKFNHPVKNILIQMVIDKAPESSTDLELILAEKRQILDRSAEVIQALRALIKEETILKEEKLKIFSKDYVELIESHITIETQQLIPKAIELLEPEQLAAVSKKLTEEDDHDLATLMETRYQELYSNASKRWEEFEDAANDFALAEFLTMGALFESIGPLTVGIGEVSKLVKDYSYKMFLNNYDCYKELLSKQPEKASDLYEKPLDCMKDCYKDYKVGVTEISSVLKKTQKQIVEPYESRQQFVDKN